MSCIAVAGTRPFSFTWFHDGNVISSRDRQRVTVTTVVENVALLTINKISPEDVGNYSCMARNVAGVSTVSATLYVEGTWTLADRYTFVQCTCLKHDHVAKHNHVTEHVTKTRREISLFSLSLRPSVQFLESFFVNFYNTLSQQLVIQIKRACFQTFLYLCPMIGTNGWVI